jgi:predicted DNA-binding protein
MNRANRIQPIIVHIMLPAELHRRLKALSKRLCSTLSVITRDALLDKIEEYERRLDASEERARLSKFEKRRAPAMMTRGLGESELGPSAPTASLAPDEEPEEQGDVTIEKHPTPEPAPVDAEPEDPSITALYEEHAQKIHEALADVTEKRLRIVAAIAAIRDASLVVEPSEEEIRKRLQSIVVTLKAKAVAKEEPPPIPTFDFNVSYTKDSPYMSPHFGKPVSITKKRSA